MSSTFIKTAQDTPLDSMVYVKHCVIRSGLNVVRS
jgi:hypothetical protein